MSDDAVQVNDIIQIMDEDHGWFACILVVAEIRSRNRGVMAYVKIPDQGEAYIMLTHDQYEIVGSAILVHNEEEEQDDAEQPKYN